MIAFCQAIQFASPINAHVTPYPAYMPGYEDDVIMAAGTFIQEQASNYQQMALSARRM